MVMGLITALWSSFLGTLGFGVLLKAPKKGLLAASVITSSENVCPRFMPEELGLDISFD